MRVLALALCAAAFATSLAFAAPPAEATTPASHVPSPHLPRSEPQASGEVHEAQARTSHQPEAKLISRSEPQASGEDQNWLGRYCTPTGCAGGASSPAAEAASFGAAAFTIVFLARRRRA